jgi:hypothetical protein
VVVRAQLENSPRSSGACCELAKVSMFAVAVSFRSIGREPAGGEKQKAARAIQLGHWGAPDARSRRRCPTTRGPRAKTVYERSRTFHGSHQQGQLAVPPPRFPVPRPSHARTAMAIPLGWTRVHESREAPDRCSGGGLDVNAPSDRLAIYSSLAAISAIPDSIRKLYGYMLPDTNSAACRHRSPAVARPVRRSGSCLSAPPPDESADKPTRPSPRRVGGIYGLRSAPTA